MSEAAAGSGGLRAPGEPANAVAPRQLFVRHARREGRSVAVLRAIDNGDSCTVEAEVHASTGASVRPGPYRFATAGEATAFVTEAVEALMYLGCDITAD